MRLAAPLLDLCRHLGERRLIAAVQYEIAAFRGERLGDAAPDAAARSGDQRHLAVQPHIHEPTPIRCKPLKRIEFGCLLSNGGTGDGIMITRRGMLAGSAAALVA